MIKKGSVVQFNENHKWCGCLGIITEIKKYKDGKVRYMVGVPMPEKGTAYIFVTDTESGKSKDCDSAFGVKSWIWHFNKYIEYNDF